jgi:serine/threonine protein kinase/tetratricopeptide (TPR) repeat protein
MNTKDWQKVNEIVLDALEIDRARRPEFIENRCSDLTEIRREVESLLEGEPEAAAQDFFGSSAVVNYASFFDEDEAPDALAGQEIGNYRIEREIGRGGMGAVYLGTRADGKFEQYVALKLLKRELNTRDFRRRFRHERQILAALQHPNIAHLLDAGTSRDNVPFLAMEYVEGLPIDVFCNRRNYDLKQRLELFRAVCEAVAFAHRNLIVHRDLKPSNILVTDDGIPKLLDFGIAKLLTPEFEADSEHTITRLGAMTPSYASPEQLKMESVSTATDVYSLGVILYELLSGNRPFEAIEGNLQRVIEAVCETEPPPPSLVVKSISADGKRTSDDTTTLIDNRIANRHPGDAKAENITAANKPAHTSPQFVFSNPQQLKGDLDNIILKALKKEPDRRYSTVEFFSEDIRRHLEGLPVAARPDTFSYRAEKFVKRNRAGVFAGGLILLTIIGGVITTLWQAQIARAERAKAERRFDDVRKLANSYIFDVFPEIEDLEGSLKAREIIIKTALEYLDNLSQEATGDAELQLELATAYEKIGEVQGAVNITNLGDINAGLKSYEKAQKLREAVFALDSKDPKNKEALSKNYQITAQTLVGNIDTAKAAEYFEKAIKLRRELAAEKPDSPDMQNRLAVILTDYANIPISNVENEKAAGLLGEAATIIKAALKNNPEHYFTRKAYPRVLRAYSRLKSNTGDFDDAIRDIDESVTLTNELIKIKPEDYTMVRSAWLNDFGYCEIFLARRDGQKIVESCLKTVDFNVKALAKEPDESFALYDLAISYYNIAQGYRLSNEPNRAVEYAQKALEPLAKLDKISPDINDYVRAIAVVKNEIADSLLMLGKTEEALTLLQDAGGKLEKTVAADKTVASYQTELAKVYRSTAAAHAKKGDHSKAAEFCDKATAIIRRLKDANSLREPDKNLLAELEKEKAGYSK